MIFDVEIYITAHPNASSKTEALGTCRVITPRVLVSVTEQNGNARLVPLDDILELDRTTVTYTTVLGKTAHPRRIDLPDKIYVETSTGHARAIAGETIAHLARSKRETPGKGVRWV